MLQTKVGQLRALLTVFSGTVHPDDECEIELVLKQRRSVSTRRKVQVLTDALTYIASLQVPDREYVANESQESTESQLEQEMVEDEDRSQTPQFRGAEEPDSLSRLRVPSGGFGSPSPFVLPEDLACTGASSSSGGPMRMQSMGRPPALAAAGASTRQGLKDVSALAHDAPGKARALLEEQQAAAPEPTSHGHVVAKSNAAAKSIFEKSGGLNETIEVVSHMLQRAEMRPIIEYLGYSRAVTASDTMLVDAIAAFIQARAPPPPHRATTRLSASHTGASLQTPPLLPSPRPHTCQAQSLAASHRAAPPAQDHLSAGCGSRSTEKQVAHTLLGKAASSKQLLVDGKVTEAARRLGVRFATFRHLLDCRLKMDAELEEGIQVGGLLKVSRLRRKDARDDDATCFDDWSHRICRYDSSQTTGGKKVRLFSDAKVDGKVAFEEHERRTLPSSRLELCKSFLVSDEYAALLERKESKPLNFSFFQKRICSCMVDEKMTQCADSIDTQFNVLFATWLRLKKEWHHGETCSKEGCVCQEPGFVTISSRAELWAFLFQGECAPEPDPTRGLPRDATAHTQLRFACVTGACSKSGCLKDVLGRWKGCPIENKEGSATEVRSMKWTPVLRGKAKAANDDDGDDEYDPKSGEAEKWSKEMLPFEASRPDFSALLLASVKVTKPRRPVPPCLATPRPALPRPAPL